jgi:hypothetical protein
VRPSLNVSGAARRRAATLLLPLLAVGALAACTSKAGSAAVVGDTTISVEDVQASTRELVALAEELGETDVPTADLNRRQVSRLVTEQLIRESAERNGVTVSDAEVDSLVRQTLGSGSREQLAQQVAVDELVPVSQFDSFAEVVVLNQKLLEVVAPGVPAEEATPELREELAALSDELDVTVSPRFGSWDAEMLDVGAPPNDLSSPESAEPEVMGGSQIEN